MSVRAKFRLQEIRQHHYGEGRTLVFGAEYDQSIEEDRRFAKATPSGRLEMYVDSQSALAQFELGKAYYFDVSEAA